MKNAVFAAALIAAIGCGNNGKSSSGTTAHPDTGSATSTTAPTDEGTPAGVVGIAEDLRKHLKPDVVAKAPADDAATKHELAVDLHGTATKVVWRAFADGANKYLLSVGLEVVTPAPGVKVEQLPAMNPSNAGSEQAVIETVPLKLRWSKLEANGLRTGEVSVRIRADGVGEKI